MINKTSGSEGLKWVGFNPANTPACGTAVWFSDIDLVSKNKLKEEDISFFFFWMNYDLFVR